MYGRVSEKEISNCSNGFPQLALSSSHWHSRLNERGNFVISHKPQPSSSPHPTPTYIHININCHLICPKINKFFDSNSFFFEKVFIRFFHFCFMDKQRHLLPIVIKTQCFNKSFQGQLFSSFSSLHLSSCVRVTCRWIFFLSLLFFF